MSLKYAILGLLEDQPYYGYEIKQKFEQMMGDLWPVSYGQLYPTLRKLADEQLVTMKTVQGKKAVEKNVYSITSSGRSAFLSWLQKNRKKVQHSIKDEFTLSFFFLERLSAEHVDAFLRTHLEDTEKRVRSYNAEYSRMDSTTPMYKRALMRKMLYHLEAEQRWIKSVMKEFCPENGTENEPDIARDEVQPEADKRASRSRQAALE